MTRSARTGFPVFKSVESRARYMAAYEAVLAQWPVPYQERDIPTGLGSTHVIVSGPPDAPPLVLLPSFAGTAVVWRLNVEALSRQYRTYAVDVISQPGKSVANQRIRNRRQFAGWFTDLLDGLGVERTSLVGCSFGAFLALSQASLTPDRIDRVVLISPVGTFVGLTWRFALAMHTARLRRWIRRLQGDKRAPDIADLGARAVRLPPRDPLWRTLIGVTMAESAQVSMINAAVLSDGELRRIRPPTLLLIGDKEVLYEAHATVALARQRMPQIEAAVVADADHVAAMAQPDDVNARILAFLQAGAPPGA